MKKFILLIVVALTMFSCDHKNEKKLLPSSVGRFNELMVVVNDKEWDGKVGIELKKIIADNVIGLPQPEPQFSITHIPHQGFDGFLKHNRNILSVERGDVGSIDVEYDLFAKPQVYVHLKGPDHESIIETIRSNPEKLVAIFKEHDVKMVQKRLRKNIHKPKTIDYFNEQGLSFKTPTDFTKVDDVKDFVWFRKRVEHYGHNVNGSLNIVSYTIPLEMPFETLKDSIVSIRDSIGKKHIPGAVDGSYLITEAAYTPHIFDAILDGKTAYKINGKWEVYKDFMAGPFVSYFVHDQKNNRLVVVEGIVYAPIIKKRDFIFEIEAIIRTLEIE